MTTIVKYEEFVSNAGTVLFIEKYIDKDRQREFYRYGDILTWNGLKYHRTLNDYLTSKPNKKRLTERY